MVYKTHCSLIWDSREPTNHRGQFFPRNDDICSSTLFALFPPICNRFFLAEGGGEEGWRGACQNECDAGGASRLPNKNHVAYSSLAWLLFLFVLSSPSLCFSLLSPLPLRLSHPGPRYTWCTTVLYVALQDAFSRSSSPYPFSINARRQRLSTTSRGTSPETRVCSCVGMKKKSGSINKI